MVAIVECSVYKRNFDGDNQIMISKKPARERILLTAHDLFYRDGIRATGVDKMIAEAGVTKVTFYRHFPSKNDLIYAFLVYRHERWMSWFKDALQRHAGGESKGLMVLVPVMEEWFSNPIFRGCAFINIAAELGDSFSDNLNICLSHKQDMVAVISELLPPGAFRMKMANAAAVAVDGAIIRAQLEAPIHEQKTAISSLACILSAITAME
jgi:AcrR family transcriptional regulator